MHHVLDLPEILYNIFGHLVPVGDRAWTNEGLHGIRALARLARTCRAFKEPALDVLWSELPDLSMLARSVPNAVYSKKPSHYAFERSLTEAEWVTIRSYARRIWVFHDCTFMETCLEEESVATLFNFTGGALFPSLRSISWCYGMPFPPLHADIRLLRSLQLDYRCGEVAECRDPLESVGLCPLIERFRLQLSHQYVEIDKIISNNVLHWSNLRILECGKVSLSADAILHLTRSSKLRHLSFVLNEEVTMETPCSDFALVFALLEWCEIRSRSLSSVASLFVRAQLPAVKQLTVKFSDPLSKQTIRSFTTALRDACSSSTLTHLTLLSQRRLFRRLSGCCDVVLNNDYAITYDDLYPCMATGNLCSFKVNFEQPVHLTDDDLVDLGSAWSRLEDLSINEDAGWRSAGGLTLHGLIRLLRACPALRDFCVLLDTSTFQRVPDGMDVSFPQRSFGRVNLVESQLEGDTMFTSVVNTFVAIGFSPRILIASRRIETEQRAIMGPTQTMCRSWQDLHDEVKARIAGGSEGKSKLAEGL